MPFLQTRLKILSTIHPTKGLDDRPKTSRNKRRLKRRRIARAAQRLPGLSLDPLQTTLSFKVSKHPIAPATLEDQPGHLDLLPLIHKEDRQRRELSTPIKVEEADSPIDFETFSQLPTVLPDFILTKRDFLRPDYGVHTCHNFPARAISEPAPYKLSKTTKRFRRTSIQIEEDKLNQAIYNEKHQSMLEENIQAHNAGQELPFKAIELSTPKKQPRRLRKRRIATMSPAIITEELDAWSEL